MEADHSAAAAANGSKVINQQTVMEDNPSRRYVCSATAECALKRRCVPCGYKILVHGDAETAANQRPERCPRMKADATKATFPLLQPAMKMLILHDSSLAFTSMLKGFVHDMHQLTVAIAEPRALILKKSPDMAKRIKKLDAQGVAIHFEVDPSDLQPLGQFDCVLWNFGDAADDAFFQHIATSLLPQGQVHITTKNQHAIDAAKAARGLTPVASVVFDRSFTPGYKVPYSDCDTIVLAAEDVVMSDLVQPVTAALTAQVRAMLVQAKESKTERPTKKKPAEKPTVDVPYEKEYFDLMNLKPKGKKHKIKRKMEYEANQEGKSRPSKRVLPVRMENGKRKKGW
ncbi:hypothetical protein LEN26_007844 [Aphanomyces euteiches]|nr:hypothetical protein LEN26_007844 [Aphanomyces euteiches]